MLGRFIWRPALFLTLLSIVVAAFFLLRFIRQEPLVTNRALTSLDVGDHLEPGLIVSAIKTERRLNEAQETTYVTFRGPLTIDGKYIHIGASDDLYDYFPPHFLFFTVIPREQLPFATTEYSSTFGGFLCFDNDAEAKNLLSPEGQSGHAIIMVDDLTISYPATEGCSKARLVKVVQSSAPEHGH